MPALKTFQNNIKELGDHFIDAIPSDVRRTKLLEAERTLNNMYKEAINGSYSAEIQSAITKALGQAGYLSNIAKKSKNPPATFYSTIKELGRKLRMLNSLLEKL